MVNEIATNGSITAAFTVYEDFTTYKSGIYHHVDGENLGGHAIKIIGYGVDGGEKYWLIANSWDYGWGEGGFFRMRRGTNECGIEDKAFFGSPKL
jgi:cathepsin B